MSDIIEIEIQDKDVPTRECDTRKEKLPANWKYETLTND